MELNPPAMDEPQEIKQPRSIRIGPDQVAITDQEVVIEAKHEMPDWQVREFRVIPIYFEDKKYFLVEKRKAEPPYAFRYVLRPWPESHIESATFFHTYDSQAVAERDSTRRTGQRDELVRLCLLPLYPFLGFLWSGAQKKLVRFGFVPQSLTAASIFTGSCLILVQGAFAAVMVNVSARLGKLMLGGMILAFASQDHFQIGPINIPIALLDSLLLLAFLADVPVRYAHYLREEEWAGGLLEWMVPRSLRKK
jgi:hypothetical protein